VTESVVVCRVEELPPGRAKIVQVRDRYLAVFHVGNAWYCIDNACPHRGGSLAGGEVVGDEVVCPWHAWPFSLKNGKSNDSDFWKVGTYPVRIEDGSVTIDVPADWPDKPPELIP
jgi:NAD(P)H-dependent nitrite reductase small subunit